MIKSMTGFGRSSVYTNYGYLIVELQSVNRKFFETNIFLPKDFFCFEMDIRKYLGEKIQRGQLTLKVNLISSHTQFTPESEFLQGLKEEWENIAEKLGLSSKEVTLSFLAEQARYFSSIDSKNIEKYRKELFQAIEVSIASLIEMKETEGRALLLDMEKRMEHIEANLSKVEKNSENATTQHREKLKKRIEEFLGKSVENEEKILREIVVFAEKVDVTEEKVRLHSHIQQFKKMLSSDRPIGRELDFLIQEMGREMNTLSVKSCDAFISQCVVEMKSELEKIREQVQNVE